MLIRQAAVCDIQGMQIVRNAVKENVLSNPALVTDADVQEYILQRGRGWVAVSENNEIIGFAIVSLKDANVWALFVSPTYENKGAGKNLHKQMLSWYFSETSKTLWLSTAPGTRAESFYRMQGWREAGTYGKGEIKFEMDVDTWRKMHP